MTTRRLLPVATVLGLIALPGIGSAGAPREAADAQSAYRMTVAYDGQARQASVGSVCWTAPQENGFMRTSCSDVAGGPAPGKPLPVRRLARLVIRTGAAPSEIVVSLAGDGAFGGWTARAVATNEQGTRWRIRLPRSIKGATELHLSADYREYEDTPTGPRMRSGGVVPFRVPIRRKAG